MNDLDLSSLDSDVVKVFEDSLKEFVSLGAELVEISLPNLSLSVPTYYVVAPAECSSNLSRFDGVKFGSRSENPKDLEETWGHSRHDSHSTAIFSV